MSNRGHFSQGITPDHNLLYAIGMNKFPGVYGNSVETKCVNPLPNTEVDITTSPVTKYVFPSDSGEDMLISSDDASDVGVLILVRGLDANMEEASDTYVLDGTNPVNAGTWSRINEIRNVGSNAFAGNISITDLLSTNIYGYARPEEQRSFSAVFSTPKNRIGAIVDLQATMIRTSGASDEESTISVLIRLPGQTFVREVEFGVQRRGNTNPTFINTIPVFVNGTIDFQLTTVNSATDMNVFVRYTVIMEDV